MKSPSVSSIGIVGNGVVGNATGEAFSDYKVLKWDLKPDRSPNSLQEVLQADVIFVCLPTPTYFDGSADLSALIDFFSQLKTAERDLPFVLRSTVPIGTTKMFRDLYGIKNILYSPEFLTARTAIQDAKNPRAMYIGSPDGQRTKLVDTLVDLYLTKFPYLCTALRVEPGSQLIIGTSCEVEAIKNFTNAFFAAKVSIFNEFKALADKKRLDWDIVVGGMLADRRIHPMHTKVPGPDGQLGYGGACLPKDIQSVVHQMWVNQTPRHTLEGAINTNKEVRK